VSLPLAAVYRNLAACHRAGIAWPRSLEESAPGEAPWREAADALRRGEALSDALAGVVPALDAAGLRAAEASGRIEEALASLAAMHEEQDRRARARRTSLAYPVVVAHLGALLLPVPDLVAGRYGAAIGWALLVLVPVYGLVLLGALAGRRGVPLTRAAVEDADARALRALGWLHEAGVPFSVAIPRAARAGQGGRVSHDLERAGALVAQGRPIAGAWRETPGEVAAQLVTAETTGALSPALERVAADLEESAARRRQRFAALLPVVVVLGLGAVVAWRVISFYAGYLDRAMR
jgi:type II secretory pathway component PulF